MRRKYEKRLISQKGFVFGWKSAAYGAFCHTGVE